MEPDTGAQASLCQKHLEGLFKQSLWFTGSGIGPERQHFYQVPGDAGAADAGPMSGTRKWARLEGNASLTPGELWTGPLMPWRGEGTYLDPPVSLHRQWAARFPAPGLLCMLSWERRLPVAEGRFSEKGALVSCYQPHSPGSGVGAPGQ